MTHSFKFYRDKVGASDKIALKHLRKTFLTKIEVQMELTESLGYQKTSNVIKKHYIAKVEVAREVKRRGVMLFGKMEQV